MNKLGFNLIELIVSIAIFGILATVVTVNLRGSSPSREAKQQANNVASFMREAQIKALAGEPFNDAVPIGGYGVHVETCTTPPCTLTMFADINTNFTFDAGTEEVNTISLGATVTVDSISTGSPVDVIFKPPRPYTCFGDVCSGIGELIISLGNNKNNLTTDVVVDQISGRISS